MTTTTVIVALIQYYYLICSGSLTQAYSAQPGSSLKASALETTENNNILILDHLNINHQKGRHDWLKAFYFDFLQCAADPRKMENVVSGKKTVWANIGANQFHLPEGKPDAQVLDGLVTLVYPDLSSLEERLVAAQTALKGSCFETKPGANGDLMITDPWGSSFRLVAGTEDERDSRGIQPGETSEGCAMRDLTIHTPVGSNLQGICRFYEQVLGGQVADISSDSVKIQVGPEQTLTFTEHEGTTLDSHVDLRDESVETPPEAPHYLSNYGPHVSMYVADLPSSYQRAEALGLAYVNPRFKRRAYTLEEAMDDCMFRCLEIVDPQDVGAGPILKLEHEVRSVVKRDGSKYKSCPFDDIPDGCVSQ